MIAATDISKIYSVEGSEIIALAPSSLTLPNCGLILVIGETGCGKSTLINLLSGQEKPTTGKVKCDCGKNYASFVFQNSMLMGNMTLRENIELTLKLYPALSLSVDALLEKYGLSERGGCYPAELSGGEQQRAAVLRAVIEDRPVLFADEPTGSLDSEHTVMLAKMLAEQAKERLVVVATHDVEEFSSFADGVIKLERGNILYNKISKVEEKENNIKQSTRKPCFGLRTALTVSAVSIRKSKLRLVLFAVVLLLTVFFLTTFINISIGTEQRQVYTALNKENAVCMDFAPPTDSNNRCHKLMSDESKAHYKSELGAVEFYTVNKIVKLKENNADAFITRLYVADSCPLKLICGVSELGDGEIAVSDYLACELLGVDKDVEFSNILGKYIGGMKTVAVYSTKYDEEKDAFDLYNQSKMTKHSTAYTNGITCRRHFVSEEVFSVQWKVGYKTACTVSAKMPNLPAVKVLAGQVDNIKTGEIIINDVVARKLAKDYNSLIGQTIKPKFYKFEDAYHTSSAINETEKEYTVVGVYRLEGNDAVVLGGDSLGDVYFEYADSWLMPERPCGLSLEGCDINRLNSAYGVGLVDWSFAKEGVLTSREWTENIKTILYIIIAVFSVITLISLVLYVIDLFTKCRTEVGVLGSLGVSSLNVASSLYLLLMLAITGVVIIITLLFQFVVIELWNAMLVSLVGGLPIAYYCWQSSIITVAAVSAFTAIGYAIFLIKIKSRTTVEHVYGR